MSTITAIAVIPVSALIAIVIIAIRLRYTSRIDRFLVVVALIAVFFIVVITARIIINPNPLPAHADPSLTWLLL